MAGFSRAATVSLICVASIVLAACSRPVGDLGRARTTYVNDHVAPKIGKLLAKRRGEEVSSFRKTDAELELEDLSWNIVRPLHVDDWVSGSLVEARRTGIFPDINDKLDHKAYLFWLRIETFRSSEARWNRVISDIRADQGAIQPFYDQARLIYVTDKQRIIYLEQNSDIDYPYRVATKARVEENEKLIQLALESLRFRYAAYDHAIKRLTVETPSPRAQIARDELEKYRRLIENGNAKGLPFLDHPELLSSRIVTEDPEEKKEEVPHQK